MTCNICKRGDGKHYGDCPEHEREFLLWWWRDRPVELKIALKEVGRNDTMRLDKDRWLLGVAKLTAQRATCLRRAVGAVLANQAGQVLATGYNGVARGMPHCNEAIAVRAKIDGKTFLGNDCGTVGGGVVHPHACAAATAPSGTQLDGCEAIHAEQNALLQCANVDRIHTCYVTCSPCVTCTKLLLNTSCLRIVFAEPYSVEGPSKALWLRAQRDWIHLT